MDASATPSFEGLGTFYLGASYDLERRERRSEVVLYDSKDLVTHAVVVGMTGSGKTGLGVVLLEEAALDGIPAIVIDPKGDLANLLLAFPQLRPADFEPWIDPDQARVKGASVAELAAQTAEQWKNGLARWGQDGARIQRLRDAVEFAVYTPGSSAGRSVSIVRSFAAPDAETLEDAELLAERVHTTVSSLLGLAGVEADPVQSREHILLSTLVQRAWAAGRDLDLGALIAQVQRPEIERIGVLDLESFYPAKERFALALALNNLLASPGFASWMQGEPLELDSLLYTPQGKPRVAIFSIAHLGDAQRMFFVSLLLNQTLGWVRRQRGTSSLRALVYMDEIAGYFPPVANPPSKAPLLTLMKQARAFGVGVVLATQNPVDLDYKGLSNAGTWFIGRLQTERDKARLLDGLEGAASGAGFERATMERALSALGARVFLMNNVHDAQPTVFETRWALSYLRGPMTRAELKRLASPTNTSAASTSVSAPALDAGASTSAAAPAGAPLSSTTAAGPADTRPVLAAEIPQFFLPERRSDGPLEYRALLVGFARVSFTDTKLGVDVERAYTRCCSARPGPVPFDWDSAEALELSEDELEHEPREAARFGALPPECAKPRAYDAWRKSLGEHLARNVRLSLWTSELSGLVSAPDESEREFRLRVAQALREQRDEALAKLRAKYAPKLLALEERRRKREQALEVQREQASSAKLSTALSFGSALLGAFLGGRKSLSGHAGRAASAARGVSRSSKESSDVERAEQDLSAVAEQLRTLQEELDAAAAELAASFDPARDTLSARELAPKKSAVAVRAVVLAWAPYRDGRAAWRDAAATP
jgi:hypothetical protein